MTGEQILQQQRAEVLELARKDAGSFLGSGPWYVSRAPGRLDVMGGIADYSGSLVLEMPLAESCWVVLSKREDNQLRVWSHPGPSGQDLQAEATLQDFLDQDYSAIQQKLKEKRILWAGYALGGIRVLQEEAGFRCPSGFNLFIRSFVPAGAGVSSSAALEVSAFSALCQAFGLSPDGLTLARWCQKVENWVVGAPCGIMDQVTAVMGREHHLLALLCRPHEVQGYIPLPEEILFVGIDSGVKHSVGGSQYRRVRTAAFMGKRLLERVLCSSKKTKNLSDETRLHYLTEVDPAQYRPYRSYLPLQMKGEDFLQQYGFIDDTVTSVIPEETYSLRVCTEHPIYEHFRVHKFRRYLIRARQCPSPQRERWLKLAGQLMYASHWSYGRCGLGSPETDLLVRWARQEAGVLGAKITGGGSGGTVALMVYRHQAEEVVHKLSEKYFKVTGIKPFSFVYSASGSIETPVEVVQ